MKAKYFVALATVGVLSLAACGSDKNSGAASTPNTVTTAAAGTATADFNGADVKFAQGMVPHHQQAVRMADIALDPSVAAGKKVLDLATRIKAAQDPEIKMMTTWLTMWGQPMSESATADTNMTMSSSAGTDAAGMDGMMSLDEMTSLGKLKGAEFDKTWMQMMVRHHQGAITMATTEKSNGSNPDAITLANKIITAQQAEIAEMKTLLGG